MSRTYTESPAITEHRAKIAALATAARDASHALHEALFDLNAALNPHDQTSQAFNSAIGFGHTGPLREVEGVQRLIDDINFDITVVGRIAGRTANVARIANNTF